MLLGGDGDDLLVGGSGRDLLIGGPGPTASSATPTTTSSSPAPPPSTRNDAALAAIMAEWTSARNYAKRTANIRVETGGQQRSNRPNGGFFLTTMAPAPRSTTTAPRTC